MHCFLFSWQQLFFQRCLLLEYTVGILDAVIGPVLLGGHRLILARLDNGAVQGRAPMVNDKGKLRLFGRSRVSTPPVAEAHDESKCEEGKGSQPGSHKHADQEVA